ncbi:MAG: phage tail tape measure protein, partial [Actinomycetota bacterium]
MADDITIDYSLNPSGYLSGAQAVSQANTGLQQSFGSMLTTGTLASKAMDAITPKRASLAGFGLMAQAAANTEQSLSGLAATATVTGVNYGKLGATIHQLARDLPLGDKAARDTVTQFTQMGVAGEGTEKKIAALATTTLKLAGATGEGPAALADGMTNLARATGNTSLDPVRFTKLADSLTTVSAQSGASATSILSFSKNIAPMAQSAGIGATGVLGISSAFARLGEDGIGATTAVNKMLTDMSRAV